MALVLFQWIYFLSWGLINAALAGLPASDVLIVLSQPPARVAVMEMSNGPSLFGRLACVQHIRAASDSRCCLACCSSLGLTSSLARSTPTGHCIWEKPNRASRNATGEFWYVQRYARHEFTLLRGRRRGRCVQEVLFRQLSLSTVCSPSA